MVVMCSLDQKTFFQKKSNFNLLNMWPKFVSIHKNTRQGYIVQRPRMGTESHIFTRISCNCQGRKKKCIYTNIYHLWNMFVLLTFL
jgi:hypothetical protein